MPALVKILLSVSGTVGGIVAGEALMGVINGGGGSTETTPAPIVSFDWLGLLTAAAIAGGIALVVWLILKRKK